MKKFSSSEMIDLLPVSAEDALSTGKLFEAVSPVNCLSEGFLAREVSSGRCRVTQVQFNGEPAFMLWTHVSADNGLWVDACQSYGSSAPIGVCFVAVEKMKMAGRHEYCRFMSIRQGLIKTALNHNFRIDGIILVS